MPKVAIVYLSFYSAETFLPDVVAALKKLTYSKEQVALVIVHNHNPDDPSSERFINDEVVPLSGQNFPRVVFLPQSKNLGFAGGCNVGIKWALDNGYDYVYLHNNDGFAAANFLEPLVNAMQADKSIGAAQSLMLLSPETNLINSAGNAYHYLGVGYCNYFRKPKSSLNTPKIFETGYCSGAALMLRSDLLRQHGLLDEDYFMYHEDLEYALRMRFLGFSMVVVTESQFFHKYNFGRYNSKFYYIERNRWGLMLTYYKLLTMILIFPVFVFWELGIIFFAAKNGWLSSKLGAYSYWLKSSSWKLWLGKRKATQKNRTQSDQKLLKNAVSRVEFDEKSINTPLLRYVANPILSAYWWLAQKLIFW